MSTLIFSAGWMGGWMDGWIDRGVMREVETQYQCKGQREELLLRGCKKDEVN